jgi:hypothetical protein
MCQLSALEARKAAVGSLLWWSDYSLPWRWGRSTVELWLLLQVRLLLLKLTWLKLWAIAQVLLLLRSA